jgi:hypothetical protein
MGDLGHRVDRDPGCRRSHDRPKDRPAKKCGEVQVDPAQEFPERDAAPVQHDCQRKPADEGERHDDPQQDTAHEEKRHAARHGVLSHRGHVCHGSPPRMSVIPDWRRYGGPEGVGPPTGEPFLWKLARRASSKKSLWFQEDVGSRISPWLIGDSEGAAPTLFSVLSGRSRRPENLARRRLPRHVRSFDASRRGIDRPLGPTRETWGGRKRHCVASVVWGWARRRTQGDQYDEGPRRAGLPREASAQRDPDIAANAAAPSRHTGCQSLSRKPSRRYRDGGMPGGRRHGGRAWVKACV